MCALRYPVDTQTNNLSVLQFNTMKMLSDDIRFAPYENNDKHREAVLYLVLYSDTKLCMDR